MDQFLLTMGAVLAANLLTVGVVWGFYNYSRLEKEGREHDPGVGAGVYLGVPIMAMLMLIGVIVLAINGRL